MANEATTSGAVTDNNNDSVATTTYVVGEHSVYKSVEDLFEGAKQKEQYIQKLLNDLKEANAKVEELSSKSNVVEQLKQIRENQMDTENTNTPLPEEAIKQIALKAMQESNEASQAESNLANCKQAIASVNSDVELALKNKAKELDCSVEYLESIAKSNPKAFKSMFGIKETMSFETINFLQSSRQATSSAASTVADSFFKSKEAMNSPTRIAEFMKKAVEDPSILANVKW